MKMYQNYQKKAGIVFVENYNILQIHTITIFDENLRISTAEKGRCSFS